MRIFILTLLILLFSSSASATVYKWIDEEGNTVFGDTPPADTKSEKVDSKPVNTYKSSQPSSITTERPVSSESRSKSPETTGSYTTLAIISPENDQAIRSNGGQVTVSVNIEPALNAAAGHQIRIRLNGAEAGTSNSSSITLQELNRGTHSISAEIIDKQGNVIKSSPSISFHLLRNSILH